MKTLDQLDHDQRVALAATDPEQFEALREATLNALIDQATDGSRPRLRSLQWRIDQLRRLAPNPMSAALRLSHMMWERVTGDGGLLDSIDALNHPHAESRGGRRRTARVLKFPGISH